jgi:hypothetical protein
MVRLEPAAMRAAPGRTCSRLDAFVEQQGSRVIRCGDGHVSIRCPRDRGGEAVDRAAGGEQATITWTHRLAGAALGHS